ncbi:TAXI family TRAP transporter solute-binding subunit [Shimia sp. Alg240-R146]|uniref:TAXI family TRAP transporter solute-binding subunit n=1 Tax=Shimia sp. Alg240-R146 TaxID=2993449 RepID=UPI0022E7BB43|nr:TAXI family TRAP transporter solute-binding subunit [Shimia sp. Alg240-R146]
MYNFKYLSTGLLAAMLLSGTANAQTNLTAETAAPVSVAGTVVLGLAELSSSAGVANIQVAPGQTLTNTVQNVAEGKTDIGSAPFLLPFLLSKGAGPYASLGKEKGAELAEDLAVLFTYRLSIYALNAYESKSFGGWDAFEGATIYNGPPRGAALNTARGMAKLATGLDDGDGYTGVQVNWGQAVKTIVDGSADANILPLNFPDGRMTQASASGKIVVYSFPKEVFESDGAQKFANAPGSTGVVVDVYDEMFGPNTRVETEDGKFRGFGALAGEVVNVSMSEEIAYALTKTFIEGIASLEAKAPMMPNAWLGETDQEKTGLCGPMPIKYHPGAVRAWEEAGYTLPDCAKP